MARLFVALWPPDDVRDAVGRLSRPAVPGLRWTTPDQWHVTLRFLGEVGDVDGVAAALDAMPWDVGPVALAAGPASDRFGQRLLHVPVAGADDLAAAVLAATAAFGAAPDDRPFRGHLTLARVSGRKGRGVDLGPLCGVPFEAAWTATEVALVASRLLPGGARYDTVATRRL